MGITEDRSTIQIHFCFVCGGPGTQTYDATRRICSGCRKLFQSTRTQIRVPKKHGKRVGNAATYKLLREQFLKENPFCWVALLVFSRLEKSNTVHHRKGRGRNYLRTSTWMATTKQGDKWIHQNEDKARSLGFLE